MDYFLQALSILLPIGISYIVMQAVLNERLKNIKENLIKHENDSKDEIIIMRKELVDIVTTSGTAANERINAVLDYVKRVEANKADRSEMNLVVDTMRRVEQKLDLLIMRDNK